jgi:hypothetical protein
MLSSCLSHDHLQNPPSKGQQASTPHAPSDIDEVPYPVINLQGTKGAAGNFRAEKLKNSNNLVTESFGSQMVSSSLLSTE